MDEIELIKEKIDLVELIQEYVPLKKAGVNYKANCPFHQERTPSFFVSPERRIWKCFGCGRSGDHFKFLMEKEGLEFREALQILAQKAGVTLKSRPHQKDETERLFEIHQKSQQFFHYLLTSHKIGAQALAYLKKRGVTDETIKLFGLGYAPSSWDSLTNFLRKRGFSVQEIIASGLGVESHQGCYDRFRGRITFPLTDVMDRIVGFSGRVLESGEPKYINTPQTKIFDRSKLLFGLSQAKQFIKEKNEAILVEGEMDMLLSFQAGVKNVVAVKGTALTEGQVEILKRYAETISLCFDKDLAGDMASRRGIEIAEKAGLNINIIQISQAKDPADLVLEDPEKWLNSVSQPIHIYDYYLHSIQNRFNLKDPQQKQKALAELIPIWQKIFNPVVKEHYIQKLAALLQIKEEVIRQALARVAKTSHSPAQLLNSKGQQINNKQRQELLEEYLLALLLHLPPSLTYIPNFPETVFTQEVFKQIYVLLVVYLDSISFKGKNFHIQDFTQDLPPQLIEQVDEIYLKELDDRLSDPKVWEKEVMIVVKELKKSLIKATLEKLSLEIKNAQEFGKIERLKTLNKRFRDLSIKLKNL